MTVLGSFEVGDRRETPNDIFRHSKPPLSSRMAVATKQFVISNGSSSRRDLFIATTFLRFLTFVRNDKYLVRFEVSTL